MIQFDRLCEVDAIVAIEEAWRQGPRPPCVFRLSVLTQRSAMSVESDGDRSIRVRPCGDLATGMLVMEFADALAPHAWQRWRLGNATRRIVCPPYDLLDMTWAEGIPSWPGIDLCWSSIVLGSPFGDLSVTYDVGDGRPSAVSSSLAAHAQARFRYSFERLIAARSGGISTVNVVDSSGSAVGDVDAMMLIAGLQESSEWRAARLIEVSVAEPLIECANLAKQGVFYNWW